jgi:hypothetical protein
VCNHNSSEPEIWKMEFANQGKTTTLVMFNRMQLLRNLNQVARFWLESCLWMGGQDGGACEQVCATKPLKSRHIQNSLSKIRYCGSGLRWNAYSFRRLASNVYFTSSTCTIALHKHQNFNTRWRSSYGVCQHILCYGLLATLEWMPPPRYTMTRATCLPDSSCKDPFEFPIHKQVLGSTETQEHRDTCICPITASF